MRSTAGRRSSAASTGARSSWPPSVSSTPPSCTVAAPTFTLAVPLSSRRTPQASIARGSVGCTNGALLSPWSCFPSTPKTPSGAASARRRSWRCSSARPCGPQAKSPVTRTRSGRAARAMSTAFRMARRLKLGLKPTWKSESCAMVRPSRSAAAAGASRRRSTRRTHCASCTMYSKPRTAAASSAAATLNAFFGRLLRSLDRSAAAGSVLAADVHLLAQPLARLLYLMLERLGLIRGRVSAGANGALQTVDLVADPALAEQLRARLLAALRGQQQPDHGAGDRADEEPAATLALRGLLRGFLLGLRRQSLCSAQHGTSTRLRCPQI